jgi:putative sterol carrier protein
LDCSSIDLNLDVRFKTTSTDLEHYPRRATIIIQNKALQVQEGHIGKADLAVMADSNTWLGFLAKERNIIWMLVRRKIRISGSLKLLQAFGKCFPS